MSLLEEYYGSMRTCYLIPCVREDLKHTGANGAQKKGNPALGLSPCLLMASALSVPKLTCQIFGTINVPPSVLQTFGSINEESFQELLASCKLSFT